MNQLRFGALLLMRGRRFGFYLSHRVVLTVPRPGAVRAAALADFQPSQVFLAHGVAVALFEAMSAAMASGEQYSSSFEMVKRLLALPVQLSLNEFFAWMRQRYGARLEDFEVPLPETDEASPKTGDEPGSKTGETKHE
jgi:hypothetical protein